jgi:tetratricopeptide (TPR) repeat protein
VGVFHLTSLFGPLLYDDQHAIAMNPAIREVAHLPKFFTDPDLFSAHAGRMYRPLVLASLSIDYLLGNGEAFYFHLGNLFQHLLVCALLLQFLLVLIRRQGWEGSRGTLLALLASLSFGLHPFHSETLCLVSSRSEVIAAIGLLVGLLSWFQSEESWPRAIGLFVGTLIACLGRETGILVPGVVLFVAFLLPRPHSNRPGFWSGYPSAKEWILSSPAFFLVLGYLQLRRSLFHLTTVPWQVMKVHGDPLAGGTRSLTDQLQEMAVALPRAFFLWVAPFDLNVDHPTFFGLGWSHPLVWGGGGLLLSIPVLVFVTKGRHPLRAIAILGALIFAMPWVLVPLNVPFAEHRMYVPTLFLAIGVLGVLILVDRLQREKRRIAGMSAACALLLFLGLRSTIRSFDWWSGKRLWESAVAKNPQSFRAWSGLGEIALREKRNLEAIRLLEHGRRVYSRYQPLLQNFFEAHVRNLEARHVPRETQRVLRLVGRYVDERWKDPFARLLIARAYRGAFLTTRNQADLDQGKAWALSCLSMVAPKMLVYRTAAEVLRVGGRLDEALALLEASLRRGLVNQDLLQHKAEILIQGGRNKEALAVAQEIQKKNPLDPRALVVELRVYAAEDRVRAWTKAAGILRRYGYDLGALPKPPSLPSR